MSLYFDYDSREACQKAIESLDALNKLISERHKAHYIREEKLHDWVLLGRYFLDSCGNSMRCNEKDIPAVVFPNFPSVMTGQEFSDYVEQNSPKGKEYWFSFSMENGIPPAALVCPECKTHWIIQNCHDTVVEHRTEVVSLSAFVGLPIEVLTSTWKTNNQAIWRLQPDHSIRNDVYIDIVGGNKLGWIEGKPNYIINPGDEALVNIWTYRHYKCHRAQQAKKEKAYFEKIFAAAGYQKVQLTETKNQYCSCEVCAPWYEVQADKLHFTIGWRKRVINIELTGKHLDFERLFQKEATTIGTDYIHAWGEEKCTEYLSKIRENA
jgi:hypothetical protein